MLPVPPPPPPPPSMPTDTSYQIFSKRKHLAMLNGEQQFVQDLPNNKCKSSISWSMIKHKAKPDNHNIVLHRLNITAQHININITLYTHCNRCDRWLLKAEEFIHMSCHAAIIKDWLFLGDRFCSMSRKQLIERLQVNYIVNGARELANFLSNEPEHIQFIKLDLLDDLVEDPMDQLKRAAQFISIIVYYIDMAHQKAGKVFVHCNVGRSRSVSAILLYMLIYEKVSISQGLKLIKEKRPIAQPNPSYMKKLLEFEASLQN